MPCDLCKRAKRIAARGFGGVLMVALAACGPQGGVSSNARGVYDSVGIVSGVSNQMVSVHWNDLLGAASVSRGRLRWDAQGGAAQMAQEILQKSGTRSFRVPAPGAASAADTDVVLVLEQAGLNALGETYAPEQTMVFNAISIASVMPYGGLAVIRIDSAQNYAPVFVVHVATTGRPTSACTVAVKPSLYDPVSGKVTRTGPEMVGSEKIPGLAATPSGGIPAAERDRVLAYCQAALRRVVSQAIAQLDLVS
jgi:hypothetical protein